MKTYCEIQKNIGIDQVKFDVSLIGKYGRVSLLDIPIWSFEMEKDDTWKITRRPGIPSEMSGDKIFGEIMIEFIRFKRLSAFQ